MQAYTSFSQKYKHNLVRMQESKLRMDKIETTYSIPTVSYDTLSVFFSPEK